MFNQHGARVERFSYRTMKTYKLPRLTDLQVAVLAAVRDGIVTPYEKRVGYERYLSFRTHGFDVHCQMLALKRRRLVRLKSDGSRVPQLTLAGVEELKLYPEY